MDLKIEFIELMKAQHPSHSEALLESIDKSVSSTSIRHHFSKGKNGSDHKVPWCKHAEYLSERKSFTLDPLLHGGAYYVQDASSMFVYYVLEYLRLSKDGIYLDLCAAPGGKSTLILDYLQNEGMLIANEVIKSRAHILQENIMKWGCTNAIVCSNDPEHFNRLENYFDVILIDAPCSGEGMFRKDKAARQEWSLEHVDLCTTRQRRIIDDVYNSLKSEGYIIYSTCTFNHEENINNVNHFINQHNLESIKIDILEEWGIVEIKSGAAFGYQFFPSRIRGEGFFISILKKIENTPSMQLKQPKLPKLKSVAKADLEILHPWLKSEVVLMKNEMGNIYAYNYLVAKEINMLIGQLNIRHSGVLVGNLQKKVFIPDHNLAMSDLLSDEIAAYDMELEEAKQYLHKSLLSIDHTQKGWLLAKYKGIGLGWLKNLGNRINNYYPSEWRIRMDIV
jgi:16S rRNA C967 or C1407 C5-methylase (RsmB/RsmF family)/NOL1/NOP2/fmu family ribosome biogenesis protein